MNASHAIHPKRAAPTPLRTLTLRALASAASLPGRAQDPISLFGVVDQATRLVRHQSQASVKSTVSGANATRRWGVRGSAYLGGGSLHGRRLRTQQTSAWAAPGRAVVLQPLGRRPAPIGPSPARLCGRTMRPCPCPCWRQPRRRR